MGVWLWYPSHPCGCIREMYGLKGERFDSSQHKLSLTQNEATGTLGSCGAIYCQRPQVTTELGNIPLGFDLYVCDIAGLPHVREKSGKSVFFQGQGNVREF